MLRHMTTMDTLAALCWSICATGAGATVTDAASALGLDAALFGSSACRRGGATDLRDKCGSDAGKQIIVQRGRWCATDIDEIYSRASLGEHVAASVALSSSGGARSLEQVVPGWAQPARFGR